MNKKKRTIYERVGRVYRVEEREMERRIECDKKKTEIRTEKSGGGNTKIFNYFRHNMSALTLLI